jgi:hypothetical protein
MRRNGRSGESGSERSYGWLATALSLAGGIGIGAGLLYLLDPESGEKRRRRLMSKASGLASSASDYAGSALSSAGNALGSALGSARDYAGEKLSGAREFASDKLDEARDYARKQVAGETAMEHRIGVGICALSSMALGAALMYVFDPSMGRSRRRMAKEQAANLASQAGEYARQAGSAIKSGVAQAREKVSNLASSGAPSDTTGTSGNPRTVAREQPSAAYNTGQTPMM